MTFKETLRYFYLKILRINDTPHRISLGIALGIFCGVLPGAGPIISLILAFIFRANKAAALLGCVTVNTWMSFLVLIPATKVGGFIFGIRWEDLKQSFNGLKDAFSWRGLFEKSTMDVLLPVVTGLFICSAVFGAFSYFISYFVIKNFRKIKEKRKGKHVKDDIKAV